MGKQQETADSVALRASVAALFDAMHARRTAEAERQRREAASLLHDARQALLVARYARPARVPQRK